MKIRTVALLSLVGMSCSSLGVYALTNQASAATAGSGISRIFDGDRASAGPRFAAGGTLQIEGRVGHARVRRGETTRTFVALEVRGSDVGATERPPVGMAVVIDRSGSMQGERMRRALDAARGLIARLGNDDQVTLISFNGGARLDVPLTRLDGDGRRRVSEALDRMTADGGTCLSCGIQDGMRELEREIDGVQRMVVLSDGQANQGVTDIRGFARMAELCRERGLAITTVGVGLDYNERILSAVASESNGRHHFVADERSLPALFEAEAQGVAATVATGAEAEIALADGVELVQVFQRSFRRSAGPEGDRLIVPLGAFSSGETKTVLVEVRVRGEDDGAQPIAEVGVRFRDLGRGERNATAGGALALEVAGEASELDPFVAARLERSRTAAALESANEALRNGDTDRARRELQGRIGSLRASAAPAQAKSAGDSRAADIDSDFKGQLDALEEAEKDAAKRPAPESAPAKESIRRNQTRVFEAGI